MTPKELKHNLTESNIHIFKINHKPRETIFWLYCGVSVTVYNMSGKFVVKGQVKDYPVWEPIAALRHILPVETVWQHTFAKAARSTVSTDRNIR